MLNRLKENRIWKQVLNVEEREFSIDYIQNIASEINKVNEYKVLKNVKK